jgi:hypothetical protein
MEIQGDVEMRKIVAGFFASVDGVVDMEEHASLLQQRVVAERRAAAGHAQRPAALLLRA